MEWVELLASRPQAQVLAPPEAEWPEHSERRLVCSPEWRLVEPKEAQQVVARPVRYSVVPPQAWAPARQGASGLP